MIHRRMLCLQYAPPLCELNKSPPAAAVQFRLTHSRTIRKLTALWEWWLSRCAVHTHTQTHPPTQTSSIYRTRRNQNTAIDVHRMTLPFLSVLASPGTLRSNRAGAVPAAPLVRSAAWRVQPPWVSLAGHRTRTKGRWVIRGLTRLPRWDSAVAIIQQLADAACCVWGSCRRVVIEIKNWMTGGWSPKYWDV